ncbi:MAG: nucleotide exchange factor GrpE [Bacteroidetes bacterium]|nr:nucleotide exchange factor GrpE [Bacteroidota bacterium]MBP6314878.1 nucleotide exchange factor GrpE [Chitinophagaceae bacterium]
MNDNTSEIIENTANEELQSGMTENQADDNMTEKAGPNENLTEESELEKWQQQVAEWKDKYIRLVAEFDNYKKRSFKEKMETIQTAGKDVMMSLLDVLDDSERAEKQMATATDIHAIKEGMQLVFNKLKHTLTQKGLKSFESIGEPFDVEKHEAVTEIPAPSKKQEGKVLDELQKGYLLNDKLIRHAKVVIGKVN